MSSDSGRLFLNTQFKIDPKSQIKTQDDGWNLNYYFREAIEYMAMVDYPYSTSFLTLLPKWPVKDIKQLIHFGMRYRCNTSIYRQYIMGPRSSAGLSILLIKLIAKVACQFMKTPGTNFTDEDLATRMYSAANIYYNTSGTLQTNCIDQSVCGDTGTAGLGDDELGMQRDYHRYVRKRRSKRFLLGRMQRKLNCLAHRRLYIYIFKIVQILECWISGCAGAPRLTDLPQIALAADDTKCMDVNQGYPWGQEVSSSTTFSTVVVMLVLLLRNCLF
ncbi:unnamed protein product [Heligmosomoides polygyrus]|uniref:Metalloprotease n=1 Tax=Heligmosomoides polygyrus TaxID=6339 RepID=A0A3P7ZWW5_HELPZ|nr:unnamed protein product [Heligmosomoides polygyrus]